MDLSLQWRNNLGPIYRGHLWPIHLTEGQNDHFLALSPWKISSMALKLGFLPPLMSGNYLKYLLKIKIKDPNPRSSFVVSSAQSHFPPPPSPQLSQSCQWGGSWSSDLSMSGTCKPPRSLHLLEENSCISMEPEPHGFSRGGFALWASQHRWLKNIFQQNLEPWYPQPTGRVLSLHSFLPIGRGEKMRNVEI